jgi:zinc transport system substrate-binding protein
MRHLLAVVAGLLTLSCSPPPEPAPATSSPVGPLSVYVVNEPLRWLAERVGGSAVEVHFPAPAEGDPAHWIPTVEEIAGYQSADLILLNGAGYAGWTAYAALPRRALVDTSAALSERLIEQREGPVHQHGPGGATDHGALRFTLWLDPTLASEQARAIAGAFGKSRPEHAASFERNLAGVAEELALLDAELGVAASGLDGAPVLFSHPVYDYLVRRYELNARSLHWEPDVLPDAAALADLDALLATHPAQLIFWEGEPLPKTRELLAQRGLESIVFSPCGNRCAEDWLATMHSNAARMRAAAGRDR